MGIFNMVVENLVAGMKDRVLVEVGQRFADNAALVEARAAIETKVLENLDVASIVENMDLDRVVEDASNRIRERVEEDVDLSDIANDVASDADMGELADEVRAAMDMDQLVVELDLPSLIIKKIDKSALAEAVAVMLMED